MKRRADRAFTLLECVVALTVLALSLMAIFNVNSTALASHVYAKKLTVANLLARSKMTDIEQQLYDKGFAADDEEDAGDFTDDGWSSFKWRSKIIAPKTTHLKPEQAIGALFNIPMGGDGKDPLSAMMSAMSGGAGQAAATANGNAAANPLAALMAGPATAMMSTQLTQMIEQLTKSVREVHLTVTWKEGNLTESLDVVTHVVSLGPGTDRNGGAIAAAGVTTQGGEVMVRTDNGQVVAKPVPNPRGPGMVDPTDGMPVMAQSQWAASRGPAGSAFPGGLPSTFTGKGGLSNLPGFQPPIRRTKLGGRLE
ncbi:MAG: prepilin-type N-terminal cleavage/methylation domain-containing protein [Myxococcaceae bacterium]|nr:prepilin-type N-terminal cleavage/methylation domain-containing protein [Myxococcaceae bacterium]